MKSPFRTPRPAECSDSSCKAASTFPPRKKLPWHLTFVFTLALGAAGIAHAAAWSIVDLATLGGGESNAFDINEAGDVSGFSETAAGTVHAFLYTRGTMRDLNNSEIAVNFGLAINNLRQVVGYNDAAGGGRDFPVVFQGGSKKILGQKSGRARDINDSGTVVGEALIGPQGESRAFIFRRGTMIDLGTLGGSSSAATSLNNSGEVVGGSATAGDASSHAFLHGQHGMADLGTLGGSFSLAFSINERREVVGESTISDGSSSHAFVWRGQTMQDLGTLGGDFSRALGINDRGQIVGISTNATDPGIRAFLYRDGAMIDLNSLPGVTAAGWFLSSANSINNAGQIVGSGVINGRTHGFLLSPRGATDRHSRGQSDDVEEEDD